MIAQEEVLAPEEAPSGLGILRPLRIRDFRLLWSGQGISMLGDQFYFVALTWLTLQLTGSSVALGTLFMAAAVPRGVLMLVGGALTDRFSPRSLMLVSDGSRAVLVAVVAALIATHTIQLWHVYVLAVLFGIVDAFFYPAISSIVPGVVDERRLTAANAIMRGTMQLTLLFGPALAGLWIAAAGAERGNASAFALDAGSFAVAAATLFLMSPRRAHPAVASETGEGGDAGGLKGAILAGLRYAWNDPIIRPLLFAIAAIDFCFAGPFEVGLAWLAHTRFDGGAAAFGAMVAGFGGGGLVGTLIGGSLGPVRRRGLVMIGVVVMLGLGLGLISIAPTTAVAVALTALAGIGSGLANTLLVSWLQAYISPDMMGRVMSIIMLSSMGLAPISFAVAGVLSSVNVVLLFSAAGGIVLLTACGAALSKPLRELE